MVWWWCFWMCECWSPSMMLICMGLYLFCCWCVIRCCECCAFWFHRIIGHVWPARWCSGLRIVSDQSLWCWAVSVCCHFGEESAFKVLDHSHCSPFGCPVFKVLDHSHCSPFGCPVFSRYRLTTCAINKISNIALWCVVPSVNSHLSF